MILFSATRVEVRFDRRVGHAVHRVARNLSREVFKVGIGSLKRQGTGVNDTSWVLPEFLVIERAPTISVRRLRERGLRVQARRLHVARARPSRATFIGTTIDLGNLTDRCLLHVEAGCVSIGEQASIPGLLLVR